MCRREKISVKSNKIFSIQISLKKTELIKVEEHLSAIDIEEVKSSSIAYFIFVQNAFSFSPSHITTQRS